MHIPYRYKRVTLGLTILMLCVMISPFGAGAVTPSLQQLVNSAKPGDIITPPPGVYPGPLLIDKAVTLDGQGKVTIDSGGTDSVIVLKADGATIRNMHLKNTGESHNDLDSGIQVRGSYNVIKDNVISDSLFGIDVQQSNNNVIARNRISSKPFSLGVRGDGIRLWYSNENRIEGNTITGSRDMVVWYSRDNVNR